MKKVAVTTSWDDGHIADVRMAKLMKKCGVTGTFYVSPKNQEFEKKERLSDEQIRELARDFEVGAHTMTHRELNKLTHLEVQNEVVQSKEYLERVTDGEVKSFCYPRGKYTKGIANIVQDLGFVTARTVKRYSFKKGNKPFEVRTSIHTYDHWSDIISVLKFVHFNPVVFFRVWRRWDRLAILMFDRVKENGGVFHLWGHSWELEERNEWGRIEHVLKHIGGQEDVQYLTNSELYE